MPVTISISFDDQVIRDFRARTEPTAVLQAIYGFFQTLGAAAAGYVVANKLNGNPLHRRTGQLAASMVGDAVMVSGLPGFRCGVLRGPALAYAGIQERGGTIYPRNAKALAMPVNDALTPAGVDRFGGPRNYPGTLRFIPFRSSGVAVGGLFDVDELKMAKGKLADVRAYYLLLSQVTIVGTHYLHDGMLEFIQKNTGTITRFLTQYLQRGAGDAAAV